ncbi:MAG: valine--tRNA ligase [Conexivisphaerales archaeon]
MNNGFEPKIKERVWSKVLENEVLNYWEKEDLYKFDINSSKPVFSIDTPPPYVNSPIHIGQAYTYTWMDAIARFKRLTGYNVLFPIGMDRNGLPIEIQTEKFYGISMLNTSREDFIKKAKELLDKSGNESLLTLKLLGHSYNSWKKRYEIGGMYETDDPEYRKLTQQTFIELFKKGLIYEGKKTSNYCYSCHTAISDAEVEYEERPTDLYYIKFSEEKDIIIATTRPELIPACKLIIFNPNDNRYTHLNGQLVKTPIFGKDIKLMAHPAAKQDFGTGLVMICSFGDYTDIRILRELNIEPTYIIDLDGKMNEYAGKYKGLSVKDARQRIVDDLRKAGLIVKIEKTNHKTPVCWRSKTPIEFIALEEIYLKQTHVREELLKIIDESNFFIKESKQLLIDWINSINVDWVLSRRRFYGTEIPLWYCTNCKKPILPEAGRYYIPWKEKPPIERCPECGNDEFVGETRIFDTWFDSSNSELYILGYLWNREFFERNFPCSLRPQGKEIVRSWLYFTILKSYLLFNKSPFKDILINYHVTDEKGEKMSKSLGNVIDPQKIIEKFGAEAFRMWTFLEGNILSGDVKYSDERTEASRKFLTKLWNLGRFISAFPVIEEENVTASERWILGELRKVKDEVIAAVALYDMNKAALILRNFVWNVFADHYVEMVKPRAYGTNVSKKEQMAAWFGLHTTFKNSLILLSPFIPFITDYLWRSIYSRSSIHLEAIPNLDYEVMSESVTESLQRFNSMIWNKKKSLGLSLKDKIVTNIPQELKPFEKDLKLMHNIDT